MLFWEWIERKTPLTHDFGSQYQSAGVVWPQGDVIAKTYSNVAKEAWWRSKLGGRKKKNMSLEIEKMECLGQKSKSSHWVIHYDQCILIVYLDVHCQVQSILLILVYQTRDSACKQYYTILLEFQLFKQSSTHPLLTIRWQWYITPHRFSGLQQIAKSE